MPLPLDSNDSLQRVHQRLNADRWEDIYIVGDVHGCLSELEALVEKLSVEPDDLVVFVGDLVRKGPDSCGVLEFVMERPNMFTVRGNNEQKLIDGDAELPALGPKHIEYIESLPVIISWDDVAVVHGGIDHRKSLAEHSVDELLNMRSLAEEGGYNRPFWFETRRESPRIFFGHTVLAEPLETEATVGLDTGCVYGRELTAYRCSTGEFISIDANKAHENRSMDSIVVPERAPTIPTS